MVESDMVNHVIYSLGFLEKFKIPINEITAMILIIGPAKLLPNHKWRLSSLDSSSCTETNVAQILGRNSKARKEPA